MSQITQIIDAHVKRAIAEFSQRDLFLESTAIGFEDFAQQEAANMRKEHGSYYRDYWAAMPKVEQRPVTIVRHSQRLAKKIYEGLLEMLYNTHVYLDNDSALDHEAEREENERLYKGG